MNSRPCRAMQGERKNFMDKTKMFKVIETIETDWEGNKKQSEVSFKSYGQAVSYIKNRMKSIIKKEMLNFFGMNSMILQISMILVTMNIGFGLKKQMVSNFHMWQVALDGAVFGKSAMNSQQMKI